MNVGSLLAKTKTKIDSLDAELIVLHALDKNDRSFLISHDDFLLNDEQIDKINQDVLRRQNKEPLAYILGFKEFYGRNFTVTPDVLIPRPESETIIDFAKEIRPKTILDVGTGSGCLAISLKLEIPKAIVRAVDISDSAIRVAYKNAEMLNAKIDFSKSDLLENINGDFDLIVANLPYVSKDWNWIGENLKFEPELALFANNNGLELIYKLIPQAKHRTKYLILESDTSQQERIIDFADKNGFSLVKKDDFQTVFKQK